MIMWRIVSALKNGAEIPDHAAFDHDTEEISRPLEHYDRRRPRFAMRNVNSIAPPPPKASIELWQELLQDYCNRG